MIQHGNIERQSLPESNGETVGVRAVERAADILVCLGKAELRLSEISRDVGLNKATVFRMLVSLERKGFVAKDDKSGRYSLDWRLWELYSGAPYRSRGLIKNAYPLMEKLWEHTGETITLYVRKGLDRLCISELPSLHPLKYTAGVGVTVPLHAGSPGKLLLAYMSSEELAEVLDMIEMISLTGKTITSRSVLRKELQVIREQGWATSFGERIEGVSSLSVPVTDREDRVVASLNILGPYVRLGKGRLVGYLDILKEAANEISSRVSRE
jgi:DNA-binding IclR family transcriptional regulator